MTERGIRPTPRRASAYALRARRPGWRDHAWSLTKATPARLALGVFTLLIGVFTALLSLPAATVSGERTPLVDALFTAVSAICVTGLTTVDTGTHWSMFGLTVIMVAMKLGGLGLMTVASLLSLSVMHRLGLAQRVITAQETRAERLAEVGGVLRTIVVTSTAFEAVTFVALTPYMVVTEHGTGMSLFLGLFYAISAFNNAGFVPEAAGTAQYLGDPFFTIPVGLAVLVGSLGFPVILVIVKKLRTPRRWSLHARLTLTTTALLLVVGFVGFALMEWSNPNTLGRHDTGTKLLAAAFAAIMPRSGGFSTLDVGQLTAESRLLTDLLMFIGGGSGSTAGGIRVTTFALLMLSIWAEVRGNPDVEVFGRRIPQETIRQAIGVLVMSASMVFLATFLLLRMTPFSLDQTLFEALSAFGTVGLSTGITPLLPPEAKVVLIACMYIGRLGPMTLGAALAVRSRVRMIQYPEERPIVG
ncbi:TrkH family potassium uptake protein [Brachybacterium aquaticum]|uniref:Potassium uptake TrkH family protein n=1 Tax=Brachybacterium aquaticum TaxID=1432564 RepID=A0A841A9F3_9MICO|nr:potassium transporter TrkG [Brachybacterium aquaticum]MBB5830577.1 potassium uptake TrkH family protein [Brachybacterium aquaticum]